MPPEILFTELTYYTMKLLKNTFILSFLAISISLTSCKKNNSESEISGSGSIEIEFENKVGSQPLVLNSQTYKNANGDDFTISSFKYYISNIQLIKANGKSVLLPETYYLIDAADKASSHQLAAKIPAGDYVSIKMTIGVDSARNFSGAQAGALDPAKGMFWTWNSGYIFVKLEGNSAKSTTADNKLTFHIGGAKAPNNTIRTVSQTFASPLRIRENSKPEMHFVVDASSLFKGKSVINFTTLNFTMGGANSVIMADNYVNGFIRMDHIHN